MKSERFTQTSSLTRRVVLILFVFTLLLSISPPTLDTVSHIADSQPSQNMPAAGPTILTLNTGGSSLQSAIIDSKNGYGYFGSGASPAVIFKIRLSDFTNVGNLTVASGENGAAAAAIDPSGDIAYIGTSSGQIIKLSLTSFTEVASISPGLGGITSAAIDTTGVFAYFGTSTGNIFKLRLSTLTAERTLPLGPSITVGSAIVDDANGYAYFGASGCVPNIYYTPPNMILKVRLSDFNITAQIDPGEDCLTSAALDSEGGFAYFAGSGLGGGHLVRIRLSDFSIAGVLSPSPMVRVGSFVLDPARGVGYIEEDEFSYSTFRLSDLNDITSELVYTAFHNQIVAALDPTTGRAYFAGAIVEPGGGTAGAIAQLTPMPLPSNDFSLRSDPPTATLQQGSVGAVYIKVDSNNYTGTVTLSATAGPIQTLAPTTSVVTPSVNLITNGENSSILTIAAPIQDDVYPSTSIISVTGTSGGTTRQISLQVTVTPIANWRIDIQPEALGLHPGPSNTASIALETYTPFSGTLDLNATIKPLSPTGPQITINPASITKNLPSGYTGISNIFISTNSTTRLGQYEVDVTGTSGNITSTDTFCLLILPQGVSEFCILSSPNNVLIGQGQTRTSQITLYKTEGFFHAYGYLGNVTMSSSVVLSPSPGAVTATLSQTTFNLPYELPGPQSLRSLLTVSASSNALPGDYLIRITATNGTATGSVDIPVVVTFTSVPGIPGLFPRDRATYHISSLLAVTSSTPVPPIPGLSQYLGGYSATFRTAATIGDETASLLTVSYLNGTQNSFSIQGNTIAESGSLFPWVIGTHIIFNNTTVSRIYAGASRETSTLKIPLTNGSVAGTGTWTWDTRTGLLLEYQLTLQGTGLLGSINAYVHIVISDTNIWTPTQPYFTVRPVATSYLTIKNNTTTKTSISIRSKNNFNGTITLTDQPLPTTSSLTSSIATTLNLTPGQNLTTPLTINPVNTGRYFILINATSGTQFHYLQLHIIVIPPPPPLLTITSLTPSPARSGDTITLTLAVNNPGTITSISINWGDGLTNTNLPGVTTITHVYTKPGTYTITITATDNTGATSTTTTTVTVNQTPVPTTTTTSTQPIPSIILYGIAAAVIIAILVGAILALKPRQKSMQP